MAQDITLSSGEVTRTTIEIIGTQETSAAVAVTITLTDGTDTFSGTLAFSSTTASVTFTGLKPATTYTASFYDTEEGSITVTTLADEPKVATQSQWEDLVSRIKNGGDANAIETVKVNGVALTPDANKAVDVSVPTQTSQLTNNSDFVTITLSTTDIGEGATLAANTLYGVYE